MGTGFSQRLLKQLSAIEMYTHALLRLLMIIILTIMILGVLAQVFSRYLLDFSLTWSEEAARICMISMVFLGIAALSRKNEHLAVTTVIELLPDRLRHLCLAAAQAVGVYCAWYLVLGARAALLREWSQVTPALQIPFGAIYSIIFVSVVLTICWLIINSVRDLLLALRPQTSDDTP